LDILSLFFESFQTTWHLIPIQLYNEKMNNLHPDTMSTYQSWTIVGISPNKGQINAQFKGQ